MITLDVTLGKKKRSTDNCSNINFGEGPDMLITKNNTTA